MRHRPVFLRSLGAALLLALAATTACAQSGSPPAAPAPGNQAFGKLADEFFDTFYFPVNPTTATVTGIHTYDSQLEDYSRAGIDHQIAALQGFDKRVSAIDAATLDDTTRGDRELVLNNIHSTLLTLQTIRPLVEKNPDKLFRRHRQQCIRHHGAQIRTLAGSFCAHSSLAEKLHARGSSGCACEPEKPATYLHRDCAGAVAMGLVSFFQHDVLSRYSPR